jgi:hypothetical protein
VVRAENQHFEALRPGLKRSRYLWRDADGIERMQLRHLAVERDPAAAGDHERAETVKLIAFGHPIPPTPSGN